MTRVKDFQEFVEQIAVSTATSHVLGSAAKSPGDFNNVIEVLLGRKGRRKACGKGATKFAKKIIASKSS